MPLQARFPSPSQVHLSQDAMLHIDHADVQIQSLQLDGALVVRADHDSPIVIDDLNVNNQGWEWRPLTDGDDAAEHEKIRFVHLQLTSPIF